MIRQKIKNFVLLCVKYLVVYFGAIAGAYVAIGNVIYRWLSNDSGKMLFYNKRELPPAILNDPIYGQHGYQQIKNIKLHYVENGDRTKPLMLFLHGFPDFWFGWREQIKYFSKHYWTVAVDMRGYGDSEKPFGVSDYKMEYLVNDVKNFAESLGREKFILVAHDWGALIAWRFILKYPEMIDSYVIVGIPPYFACKMGLTQLVRSWYIFFFQLPFLPELWLQLFDMEIFDQFYESCDVEIKEAYKFVFGKSGGFTGGLNYYRANLISSFMKAEEKPKDVQLPYGFLLYTDNDPYVDVSSFEGAKQVSNLKVELLKGAGHFLHQIKPQEANNLIAKFLGIEGVAEEVVSNEKGAQPDASAPSE